ncbi:MAG: phytase [Gemmatirosa sp.]
MSVAMAMGAVATACGGSGRDGWTPSRPRASSEDTVVVREAFGTPHDTVHNVDSPAVWHRADGSAWLLATAKTTDLVLVHDASTGRELRRLGGSGTAPGRLSRPNGILVIDSLLLVVERDNRRVQAFRLPSLAPLGVFGDSVLRKPYGIAARALRPSEYAVYVTDNYETADGGVPPLAQLGARVHEFRVRDGGPAGTAGAVQATHVRSFGDTTARGALRIVESIAVDPTHGRLLIAEELETDSHLKVYDLAGRYTGRDVGRGRYPQQAEGIALYACGDSAGYWVTADQGERTNTFHVYDRITLDHLGAFTGARTRLTDGVAVTSAAVGRFGSGALYASHLDGGVSAFDWAEVARDLGLPAGCEGRQRTSTKIGFE